MTALSVARLTPEETRQVPRAMHNVEHAHGIFGSSIKDEVIAETGYRDHSHIAQPRSLRGIIHADSRLRGDLSECRVHRVEHPFRGCLIVTRDVGVNLRQIICDDRRMALDPHSR